MKLGPVAKLEKRNTKTSKQEKKKKKKKNDDDVMSANCDVIVIFPVYVQFGAI